MKMKKSLRMLALVLSFIMVLGMLPAVHAEQTPVLAKSDDIVVYYTNDIHTYIDGALSYDNIADLKKETAKQAAGVLLVDAGDHIQGTAYGSMDKGASIVELMEAAGYDVATLGNHEFDYGMERALEVALNGSVPYISSNFYHEENGWPTEHVLEPYKIFQVGGKKIAFIGITTPETFTKSTPAYFQDENGNYIYGIGGGDNGFWLYLYVQDAIYAAQNAGADYIIALGHLGVDESSKPWTSREVIANVKGLDAFIDGHSHTSMPSEIVKDEEGNDVILTQTGEYFDAVGKLTISADGTISTELVTEWTGSDAAVKAIKDEWMTEIDTKLGEVIGRLEVTLDNYDENGGRLVRKQETNTGAFAADALYYLFDNMGLDVDVAIMNGGGVRNKALTGEFSYKTAKEIHTFGNVACLQTVTGQQLLDALEWGAKDAPDKENGGFLHVSGITYEIDLTIPSTVQKDEKGVWTGSPTGAYRVRNVRIMQDGEWVALDLNAQYNLAGYNYTLRDLGDGFAMFDGAVNVLDYVMEDYMVLANYMGSFPVDEQTGLPTVTADNSPYGQTDYVGRIRQVEGFRDVPDGSFYYDAVQWAVEQGITTGIGDGTFLPDRDVTRAEVVTFLWRANGCEAVTSDKSFPDVKETDFFYSAVIWAAENGITTGKDSGLFDPYATCTRAEALTFLWRAEGTPACGQGTVNEFSDVDVDDFFAPAVMWAVSEGITNGIDADSFGSYNICNRAHIVTFLYRNN